MVKPTAKLVLAVAAGTWLAAAPSAGGAEAPRWLGDELPLPLAVKTPQDIGFKAAAERQYLIFNLMAGGKLAYQRGDYATAVDKWETLLRVGGLDPQIEKAVAPFLADARAKLGHGAPRAEAEAGAARSDSTRRRSRTSPARARAHRPFGATPAPPATSVTGTVSGGGQIGPGGAVLWLKRLDGSMPRIVPPTNQMSPSVRKRFYPTFWRCRSERRFSFVMTTASITMCFQSRNPTISMLAYGPREPLIRGRSTHRAWSSFCATFIRP